ncbi:MAG: hypothetical protein QJR10_15200 [Bacillota bacterium]|nr:hypothetical protein [Bacillota bacterium]
MKTLVGFDICNTLADVEAEIERIAGPRPEYTRYFHPAVSPAFFEEHPEVFADAAPFTGAAEALQVLAASGKRVVYITARPQWARQLTLQWLEKHGFPAGEVICTQAKPDVIRQLGVSIYVEDAPRELQQLLVVPELKVFRKWQPWNEVFHGVPMVSW